MQLLCFGRIDGSRQLDRLAIQDAGFDWAHRPLTFRGLGLRFILDRLRSCFSDLGNRDLAATDFEIGVLDLHANSHVLAVVVNQIVVGVGIGREPILAVDLFTIRFHYRELILFSLGDAFALRLQMPHRVANHRQVLFGEDFGSPIMRRATSFRQLLAFAVLSGQQPAR